MFLGPDAKEKAKPSTAIPKPLHPKSENVKLDNGPKDLTQDQKKDAPVKDNIPVKALPPPPPLDRALSREEKRKIIHKTSAHNMAAPGSDLKNSKACTIL